ncbi:SOS response-associated peptidase family protein [Thalassotalea sp. Y01]|uniref:SOS response-associated peptidase family protein n=1 Tax=Thalassotalea sp. Y01 TaxID=2729613 RepID=UPI00145CED27|nr:SOS response-associated peptidase family protein [Thalassotalea sp. Y01]NMP15424.1 SOS response-associated peptidase [Thalassotalea sp. Y01]
MCGRLNISDDPFVEQLLLELGIENPRQRMNFSRFKRATDSISIVREHNGKRRLDDATWWLLLDKDDQGFKPSKYTSFNTRYDKLNVPRSAGFKAFRESRCVVVAKGFGETEFVNRKPIHYFDMTAEDGSALALGGLYRQWYHPKTGQTALSCSVITLPPHPKLSHIHSKAMPLILPQDDDSIAMWLNANLHNVEVFNDLLKARLPQNLLAWPIDKPSLHNAIGAQQLLVAD